MTFTTWRQLHDDLACWERVLPHFDFVTGVPRSGLFPASFLALRRNLPMISLPHLLENPETAAQSAYRGSVNQRRVSGNRLLIVDDSVSESGKTFTAIREQLRKQTAFDISYGAVYRASEESPTDFYFRDLPRPRLFEWNWHRHNTLKRSLLDMDGVLCEDWPGPPEKDDDPAVIGHFRSVAPLYLPSVPILGIVTSRLEKFRAVTEQWLQKHGVLYGKLVMHPAEKASVRQKAHDNAIRKAAEYSADSEARLFVESSEKQARSIAKICNKPVLCTDTMELY